jgi:Fe2+ or Zn2+ uptake regulation protein
MRSPDALTEVFRGQGLKVTPQRQCIFRALHGNEQHPTADAVFDLVRAEMPTISLRTVYQTLNDLAAMGEVTPIDLGTGSTRFDPNLSDHHHLVCDRCGAVHDIAARLERPAGVAWGVKSGIGNDMRGVTLRPLRGRQSVAVEFGDAIAHVGPLGFLQPNPAAASIAYHDLVHVPAGGALHGRLALDLYAGAGVTTSLLRSRFDEVVPCESYPESARTLGCEPELVEEFLARLLADAHHPHRSPDLVVANPPRGGLGGTVCEQLNELHVPRLHLMSCNPASLAEDLRRLTGEHGRYRVFGARAFDTLPQTNHIEVVVWLVGRAPRSA